MTEYCRKFGFEVQADALDKMFNAAAVKNPEKYFMALFQFVSLHDFRSIHSTCAIAYCFLVLGSWFIVHEEISIHHQVEVRTDWG